MVIESDVSSIFPSCGSMSRRALCSAGSLGTVPPPPRLLRRAPGLLPTFPTLAHTRTLGGSVTRRRGPALPSSSATLATHAPGFDPGGAFEAGLRGCAPTLRLDGVAFRVLQRVGPRNCHFGTQFRSLRARCLRFVTTVARRCFTVTQDSLPAGGPALAGRDSNPLGREPGFVTCWRHMASSRSRLAWRTERGLGGEGHRPPASRPRTGGARARRTRARSAAATRAPRSRARAPAPRARSRSAGAA